MDDFKFWRGIRNAIIPSALLWALIVWALASLPAWTVELSAQIIATISDDHLIPGPDGDLDSGHAKAGREYPGSVSKWTLASYD
jgi:hypothetical protein